MKIPYSLIAAVSVDDRRKNMASALERGLPRLQEVPLGNERASIACFGPSLVDTWQDIQHPIISVSGATKFLADRGIIPDYHVDMDPRPHKVKFITPPIPGVVYLIASVCDPTYFDTLKDERVVLWHCVNSTMDEDLAWLQEHDPNQICVSTGSNVGLGAIQIGGILGFRHFEIYGMDGSFSEKGRHADIHYGKEQKASKIWKAGGKTYYTSKVMANGVAETINSMRAFPVLAVFHGEGLTQSLIEEENLPNVCTARQKEKADKIRGSVINVLALTAVKAPRNVWEAICYSSPEGEWLTELQTISVKAEELRSKAKFNTGSVPLETMLLLRSLCEARKPEVIIEVGTFIGKSTMAMKARRIYTCDKDNDCLESTESIKTFPYKTAREMFETLVEMGVKADLFFFDGRLQDGDTELILKLSKPETVYAFDDFHRGGKGEANVARLMPELKEHGFVAPHSSFEGRSTLALLYPLK